MQNANRISTYDLLQQEQCATNNLHQILSNGPSSTVANNYNSTFRNQINSSPDSVTNTISENQSVSTVSVPYLSSGINHHQSSSTSQQQQQEQDSKCTSFGDESFFSHGSGSLSGTIESDLIDLTSMPMASKSNDMYSADIDYMNNYLKSLPDYSNSSHYYKPPSPPVSNQVKLREHPTPKPFFNQFASDGNAQNFYSQPLPVQQSPKQQRKQVVPLSKSNSVHTFSKRNIGNVQSTEKESFSGVLKNKICRSTSSSTVPNPPPIKESTSDQLIGFMKKPSSLMNIFKKLGSQNSTPSNSNTHLNQTNHQHHHSHAGKNVHSISKTPSVEPKKSIGDFWKDNLSSQQHHAQKFGWNYQKIMSPHSSQKQQSAAREALLPAMSSSHQQPPKSMPSPSTQRKVIVKKLDPIVPIKTTILTTKKTDDIHDNRNIVGSATPTGNNNNMPHHENANINNSSHDLTNKSHKQNHKLRKNYSHSQIDKKLKENVMVSKEDLLRNNGPSLTSKNHYSQSVSSLDHRDQHKILKSSSNSHIYMNQDDPNYFKNLHKITKTLDNATTSMINKPLHKSISNTCVPAYLNSSPSQQHIFYPGPGQPILIHHLPHGYIHPYPPIAFKPPPDHMLQHSGSKSNIPICYKYPLSKSASNSSVMTHIGPTVGFYSLQEKPVLTASGIPLIWPTAPAPPQHINKSSSSSCIYAKTLSQPAHLSKNNDIFARYKPIMSDDDESDDDDDDTSKRSNVSKNSYTSVNKVPAPAPFKTSTPSIQNSQNYPQPFTKISTIQIPINGQLPPAFSKDKNNNVSNAIKSDKDGQKTVDDGTGKESNIINNIEGNIEQSIADIYNVGNNYNAQNKPRTTPIAINATNKSIQSPASVPSTPSAYARINNIFYGFMNPLAAAAQSINHMQTQQQDGQQNVGGNGQIYTPYTKYLTDRKYFDMPMGGVTTINKGPSEQKRASGTNKSMIPTFKDKVKTINDISPANVSHAQASASCYNSGACNGNNNQESADYTQAVPTNESVAATSCCNYEDSKITKPQQFDDTEILRAFDPYFVPSSATLETSNASSSSVTSNKLQQLLTTVNEQWTNMNCDDYATALMSSSKQSCDNYGTDQYVQASSSSSIGTAEVDENRIH